MAPAYAQQHTPDGNQSRWQLPYYYIFPIVRGQPPVRINFSTYTPHPQSNLQTGYIDLLEDKASNPILKLWIEDELRHQKQLPPITKD